MMVDLRTRQLETFSVAPKDHLAAGFVEVGFGLEAFGLGLWGSRDQVLRGLGTAAEGDVVLLDHGVYAPEADHAGHFRGFFHGFFGDLGLGIGDKHIFDNHNLL